MRIFYPRLPYFSGVDRQEERRACSRAARVLLQYIYIRSCTYIPHDSEKPLVVAQGGEDA